MSVVAGDTILATQYQKLDSETLVLDDKVNTISSGSLFTRAAVNNTNAVTLDSSFSGDAGTLIVKEPNLTVGTGTLTNAFTLKIDGAPTEGASNNYALWVTSGLTSLGGDLSLSKTNPEITVSAGSLTIRPGNTLEVDRSLNVSRNVAGTVLTVSCFNSNGSTGAAALSVQVGNASSEDAYIHISESGGNNWRLGLDNNQSDRFALGPAALGFNDALRITQATPPVISFNTNQGSDFDYVCETCGKSRADIFTCCGKVEWHDDVMDFRAMKKWTPESLVYMNKIGIIDISINEVTGKQEVFTNIIPGIMFVGAMAHQNRQRIDNNYYELSSKVDKLIKENNILREKVGI